MTGFAILPFLRCGLGLSMFLERESPTRFEIGFSPKMSF
jgi:hypothetical protein